VRWPVVFQATTDERPARDEQADTQVEQRSASVTQGSTSSGEDNTLHVVGIGQYEGRGAAQAFGKEIKDDHADEQH